MPKPSTLDRVVQVLSSHFGVLDSEITPNAHIDRDLGADSLDHIEVLMELEDEFGIQISDEEAEPVRTVAEIVRLVEVKLNQDI